MGRAREPDDFDLGPGHPVTYRPARRGRGWLVVAVVAVLAAGGAAYLYRHPQDAPAWLRASGVLPKPAPTVVYRWRDRAGAWQITDQPPPEGTRYERLEYGHDTNVMPIVPP